MLFFFLNYLNDGEKDKVWGKLAGNAPLAQLDRVVGFEPIGREFESLRVRHLKSSL